MRLSYLNSKTAKSLNVGSKKTADFRCDPLIYNQATSLPKAAEMGVSDDSMDVVGFLSGTRPISVSTKLSKVERSCVNFHFSELF